MPNNTDKEKTKMKILNNPREKYLYIVITLIGWFLCGMVWYTGDSNWYFIFMGPLFALTPIILIWVKFIDWIEKGTINEN